LQDNAVHATHPLSAGSVLGVYRSMTMLPSEELHFRHHSPDSYPKSTAHWRQAIDAYAAELAPPPQQTWGKKLLREVFDKALQVCPWGLPLGRNAAPLRQHLPWLCKCCLSLLRMASGALRSSPKNVAQQFCSHSRFAKMLLS